jgi:flagellar biosynthetic protein FlhB
MAEENSQDNLERSEEATPKRRDEARKQGQFARSKELIPAATLTMLLIAMRFAGAELLERQGRLLAGFISAAGTMKQFDVNDLSLLSYNAGGLLAPVLLPVFGAVLVAALASGFMQTGMVLAEEPVRFDLARISPLAGWRRLFSLDAVADLIKAMLFIGLLGWIGGKTIYSELPRLASLANIGVAEILEYTAHEVSFIGTWIIATLAALAGLDYLFQRWRTETKLRMSRQEVKEEMREQDGDPLLRSRIKSLRQKMARQRMMSEVAKADVVITNPTELAIALRYRAGEMSAPKVLGKGAGYVAQKIREVARGNSIPIVENKPLARLLFKEVEIGREVPEALYRAVAETLAYVYRLRRGGAAVANPEGGRG